MSLLNVNQVSVSIDHELPILHDTNLAIREG